MSKTRSKLACAIIDLRATFDENQQRFSDRLDVSMITVARWEIDNRHPSIWYLRELYVLAAKQGRRDLAQIFSDAFFQVSGVGLADQLIRDMAALRTIGDKPSQRRIVRRGLGDT